MKVLVTGANGFLGSKLVEKLLSLTDYEIRCFVRSDQNLHKIIELSKENEGRVEIIRGSLLNPSDCLLAADGIDIVFHLAAATSGAPAEMFLNSSVATDRLMSAVISSDTNTRIVFCSSFSVYGTSTLPVGAMINEQTPLEENPTARDIYALTKYHQEQIMLKYHREKKLPLTILRPGVIYGPGSSGISGRVGINLFGLFLLMGNHNLLPLTYVDNCAEAFVIASQKSTFQNDIYNVVDDNLVTCKEFLHLYRKNVKKIHYIPLHYSIILILSFLCEKYYAYSNGQLPDIFTRYKSSSIWRNRNYTNNKLKSIGWKPGISTGEGLTSHFSYLKMAGRQDRM
ncbi:MAG: NAD(P)-dependent oxidoreductase [Desulfobacteraceae bacterium]|nr:MAG: NAD(P)-dependent oxidoreductase [Desulfobacteraceae bacterium]